LENIQKIPANTRSYADRQLFAKLESDSRRPTFRPTFNLRRHLADVHLHVFNSCIELVVGSVGEQLFVEGDPWTAYSDNDKAPECVPPLAVPALAPAETEATPRSLYPRTYFDRSIRSPPVAGCEVGPFSRITTYFETAGLVVGRVGFLRTYSRPTTFPPGNSVCRNPTAAVLMAEKSIGAGLIGALQQS
jgi:hypothetical protein